MPPSDLAQLIDEDRPFQMRFWKIQRLLWIALALILLFALAGFTGRGGPFSRSAQIFGKVAIEYPQSWRLAASDRLMIEASGSKPLTLSVDAALTDIFEIEAITPEPSQSQTRNGRLVYSFDGAAGGAQRIAFTLKPTAIAWGDIFLLRIGDGPAIALRFAIWP